MKKVYLVGGSDYDGATVFAVFDNKDAADACLKNLTEALDWLKQAETMPYNEYRERRNRVNSVFGINYRVAVSYQFYDTLDVTEMELHSTWIPETWE